MFRFLDNLNNNQTILVCDNDIHILIQEYYQNKMIPIKVMDYSTFINYYLGTIDDEVYVSLVKNNVPYELSKILVSHFLPYYYLNISDKRIDEVKDIILKHLKINKYIQNELKQKEVIFINPDLTNDLVKTVLNIDNNITIKEIYKNNNPSLFVVEEKDIDTEVDKMFNLLTNDLVTNQEDIYLYLTSPDYLPIVLSKLNLYKLKYTTDLSTSLMDLVTGKELIQYLDKYNEKRTDMFNLLNEAVDYIKNNYKINEDTLEKIYKVLSNFTKYNIEDYNLIIDILKDDLKNITVVDEVIKTNLKVITKLPKDLTSKIIYILGANQNNFPSLIKDRDYFNDRLRLEYNLTTSVEKNQLNRKNLINSLNSTNYAYISFNTSNEKIKSDVLDKLVIKPIAVNINNATSQEVDDVTYSKALDKYYIYKELSNELTTLYNEDTKNKYNSYDNQFKGSIKITKDVTLSATSLERYYECNFKYYLEKVLKIKDTSDKRNTYIGTYFHLMLKKLFEKQIDLSLLETETIKYIEETPELELDKQTEYYYLKFSKYVESAYLFIQRMYHQGDIFQIEYEKELTQELNSLTDKNYNDKIRGFIDKYFIYKIGEAYKVLIVDYKTSDKVSDLALLPYGLDVQLPFYFYLLSQGDLHYELVGSFIQQVMPKDLYNKEDKKTIESRSELDMLYRGYIVDGYQDQVIIRNKKNAITVEQTKEIIQQVDNLLKQAIKNIHNGDFKINPKFIENKVNPCKYCPYLSICYKKVTDYVLIDLKNKGGEENDQ